MTWLACDALALILALGPGASPENQPARDPEGPIAILSISGMLLLGGYAVTARFAASRMDDATSQAEFDSNKGLLVPIVGPFIAVPDLESQNARAAAIFSGVLQTAAATSTIVTSVLMHRHLRRYPKPPSREAGIGLLAAGLGTLGATTLTMGIVGGVALRRAPGDPFWRRMLIPVGGGFAAMPETESYSAKWHSAVVGTLQVAAVGLTVAGTAIMLRTRPLSVTGFPTPGGARISFAVRF